MGSYPHVNPGDVFKPSVQEENDIRDLLNAVGRDGVRSVRGGMNVENICINAYNSGSEAIPSGTVVIFADAPMIEGAVQVAAMPEEDETAEWAIPQEEIPAHGFGSILVMGAVIVPISGETGNYAVPVGGGTSFARAATGVARILRLIGSTSALILVGSSSGGNYVAGNAINSDELLGGTISVNYSPGKGISMIPITGSTNGEQRIDANITGGTDISVTGGSDGNPYVVAYTGSGGDVFHIPPYSALTISGSAPEYGLGHTFLLRVKAGSVGFYDDGRGAVGVWCSEDGTSSTSVTAGTPITTTEDGYLRISVVDNGQAPGACLGFGSPTGGFPLYKYGMPPFAYAGAFKAELFYLDSTPGENILVSGHSIGVGAADSETTRCLRIYDTSPRDNEQSYQVHDYAGWVLVGDKMYHVDAYQTTFAPSSNPNTRTSVYLIGTIGSDNELTLEFQKTTDDFPNLLANQFCARICYEYQGVLYQTQFGDIIQPSFPQNLDSVGTTSTATLVISGSTDSVVIEPGNENITIDGSTNGRIRISASGGGGGGGIGYPDYLALNKLPSGGTMPSGEGIGTTYLLPVPAGKSIKYYSPLQYCVALFAVADGWDGTPYVLTNDTAYTTPAAGWVRISILDDGDHQNGCLRFYVGTSDWTKALPLYRCGTFHAGATGISSSVSGGTATISLTGGTGSVKVKPGNNVLISGTNGVIEISATGGGGGGVDFEGYTTQIEASYLTVPVDATEYIDASVNTHYVFSFEDFISVGSTEYYNCYWNANGKFKTPFGADSGTIYNYYSSGQGYGRELKLPSPDTGGVIEVDTFFELGNIIISSTSTICNEDGTINDDWTDYGFVYISGSSRLLFVAHSSEHAWYMKIT